MSHSKMLKTRRKRQKHRKELAGIAKRAKKLRKQHVKVVSGDALTEQSIPTLRR